jgi:hypothetical protein
MAEILQPESAINKAIKIIEEAKKDASKISQDILTTMKMNLTFLPIEVRTCRIGDVMDSIMHLIGYYHSFINTEEAIRPYYKPPLTEHMTNLREALDEVAKAITDYINENCIIPEKRKP